MTAINEVVDKTVDRWIKVVGFFAAITIPLIGVIGGMIIYEQRSTNEKLEKVVDTLTKFSVRFENHEGRISTLESDVKEVKGVINNYQTKGKKHGR